MANAGTSVMWAQGVREAHVSKVPEIRIATRNTLTFPMTPQIVDDVVISVIADGCVQVAHALMEQEIRIVTGNLLTRPMIRQTAGSVETSAKLVKYV